VSTTHRRRTARRRQTALSRHDPGGVPLA
jgi:hypothetical protein